MLDVSCFEYGYSVAEKKSAKRYFRHRPPEDLLFSRPITGKKGLDLVKISPRAYRHAKMIFLALVLSMELIPLD
jgi:hypothetical protein